jgi:hypothetical protein
MHVGGPHFHSLAKSYQKDLDHRLPKLRQGHVISSDSSLRNSMVFAHTGDDFQQCMKSVLGTGVFNSDGAYHLRSLEVLKLT